MAQDACAEGAHVVGYPPNGEFKECRKCGVSEQTLYDSPRGAALDDFRVVCREPECQYGDRLDRDGHGYTNHVSLGLAKTALLSHQRSVEGRHQAQIEQHPIEAVVEVDRSSTKK